MAAGKGVILTFLWRGERLDATQLTVGTELFATTCQDLMTVCLMTHVPDDAVLWCVIDIMQGDSDLNDAEAGSQMAGIDRHLLHDILAQLFAEQGQIVHRQLAQILRVLDLIE